VERRWKAKAKVMKLYSLTERAQRENDQAGCKRRPLPIISRLKYKTTRSDPVIDRYISNIFERGPGPDVANSECIRTWWILLTYPDLIMDRKRKKVEWQSKEVDV
jgi:hypothetical protein